MYTELSKYISLILRHTPEVIGITLDEHGWAKVSELIEGLKKTHSIDMEILEEIVHTDEKQRYSFNEEKTLIRANQGHSVEVDVELQEAIPPEILWHGTGLKFVDAINQEGLIAKSRLYVHLSADYATALKVGARHGMPGMYQINTKRMIRDGYHFYLSANGVWLTKEVPKKYLKRLITLHDPIEDTEKYKQVIQDVDKKAQENIECDIRLGRCQLIWSEKKRILQEEYGIEWKTPAEMNPNICFD